MRLWRGRCQSHAHRQRQSQVSTQSRDPLTPANIIQNLSRLGNLGFLGNEADVAMFTHPGAPQLNTGPTEGRRCQPTKWV